MIKITADSTCDLSQAILETFNIDLVPLHIAVNGNDYRDGVDISPSDIVNFVENENKICQTAAVNAFEYQRLFSKLASEFEAVIHVISVHNSPRVTRMLKLPHKVLITYM